MCSFPFTLLFEKSRTRQRFSKISFILFTNGSFQALYPVICELRAIKTELELQVMRFVARASSVAHKHVMRNIKPGMKVASFGIQCLGKFPFHK